MILIYIITVAGLAAFLVMSNLKYKTLKLEWEEMNSDMDVLTSNYNKAKKEISDLQDQNDDLAIKHSEEIQKLIAKYEKKVNDAKAKIKAMQSEIDALLINESNYLTSLEEAAAREASLLNTIDKLEKKIELAAKKKTRAAAKKKKEEESKEQLEIAFEKSEEDIDISKGFEITIDDVEIAPGEGETKCEKKRGRKKRDNN